MKKYLLYGKGFSNQEVAKYLISKKIDYEFYIDGDKEIRLNQNMTIIKSPGIKPQSPFLVKAKEEGLKIVSLLDFYYQTEQDKEIIIVTGTNGKTTTCQIIYELLKNHHFVLGGNMGKSLFNHHNEDGIIIEASSFMLVDSNNIKPHFYVVTNLSPHHLDFHLSKEAYFKAKLHLIDHLDKNDFVICEKQGEVENYCQGKEIKLRTFSLIQNADAFYDGENIIYQNEKICRLKVYNWMLLKDLLIGVIVAKEKGIKNDQISNVLHSFVGLEHRYEIFYQNENNIFINDSKSTSAHALVSALENTLLYFNNPIVLIMGGKDTKEDYLQLLKFKSNIKTVYLYGENRFLVASILNDFRIRIFKTLNECLENLFPNLEKGDLVLFSPGASSLDQFSSFAERGDVFKSFIKKKCF